MKSSSLRCIYNNCFVVNIVVVLNFDCTDGQLEAKGLAFVIRFPVMESWTITHNSDTPVVHKVRDDIIKLS